MCVLACVCGCGSTDKSEDADSLSLSIALLPTLDNLPFYYADSTGIFDSLGIAVDLQTYCSAMDCDTAFRNGKANGVVSDLVKANVWRASGDSVRVIMSGELNLYLMTARSARIKNVKSLKEKIVAVTRNSSVDYLVDRVMDSARFERWEINRPQINNIVLRCDMTNQNQFDCSVLPEPYAAVAESHGGTRLLASSSLTGNLSAFIVHDSICKKRKNDLRVLVKAYNIAVERLNSIMDKGTLDVRSYLPEVKSLNVDDSLLVLRHFNRATLPSKKTIENVSVWVKGRELVSESIHYDVLVDSSFVK